MKIIEKTIHRNIPTRFDNPLYIDIETTGLSPDRAHTYLVGVCFPDETPGTWHFRQWLAENPLEERMLISEVNAYASGFSTFVHYNGNHFDLPWLNKKALEFGLDSVFCGKCSVDLFCLLRPCRVLFGMQHCRQKDFEGILGIDREDRYDGGKLIEVYHHYVKTGSADSEHLLLIHNEEDVLHMANLTSLLPYTALFHSQMPFLESIGDLRVQEDRVLVLLHSRETFPVPASFGTEAFRCSIRGNEVRLSLSLVRGTLKYFLAPVRDYYYLPEEDMAIHKSVATYVDASHRIKATPETCYIRKEGLFLRIPGICPEELKAVLPGEEKVRLFSRIRGADPCVEWREDLPPAFWEAVIRHMIP